MFSFLGELMALVAWLLQQGRQYLSNVWGTTPAGLELWTISSLGPVNSCNSSWPAKAAHRLAIGPPWDRDTPLLGDCFWRAQLVVSIPSSRSVRG